MQVMFAAQGCGRLGLFVAAGVILTAALLGLARAEHLSRPLRWAVAAAGLLLAAAILTVGAAQGQQPYGGRPAARQYAPSYQTAPTYGRPLVSGRSAHTYQHDAHVREVVIVEAVDFIFDVTAKDVFVFTGPPRVGQGVAVGVRGNGAEARVLVPEARPAQVPAGTPPQTQAPKDAPAPVQAAPQLAPKEQEAVPAPQKAVPLALASLATSCASCHTQGKKVRGNFTLFDEGGNLAASIDWRKVLERVDSADDPMPPASSGLPKVSAQDRADIARLAK